MDKKSKKNIDFNCDITKVNFEDDSYNILDYVSSVNIPCGVHSGSARDIKFVTEQCKFKNKVIGASIGLPSDITNPLALSQDDIESIILYQLGALNAFAKNSGLIIEYVRPIGSMYELAACNFEFSLAIANSIKKFGNWLLYYGAAGEVLNRVSAESCINIASEVNLQKPYLPSGLPDFSAQNLDNSVSLDRLKNILNSSKIELTDSTTKEFNVDTIHFDILKPESIELIKDSVKFLVSRPVNYNKALPSGWV